jgi:hypothetical protein
MLNRDTLVTSSGIVRNRSKPRTGIVSSNSLYGELFDDCINRGIDLTWETFREERMAELTLENPELDETEIQDLFENDSGMELDSHVFLLGAWVKNSQGMYEIDKTGASGSFALEYNTETGNVCVEWSIEIIKCGNTSPCYVMSDGSGPCGNLDSTGDAVTAYTLPDDMFRNEKDID